MVAGKNVDNAPTGRPRCDQAVGAPLLIGFVVAAMVPGLVGGRKKSRTTASSTWNQRGRSADPGKIEYNLPTKKSLPAATLVSVVVHGYEDVSEQCRRECSRRC